MSKEQQQYQKLVMTPVEQLIPRLAVPTILSMMITMIYNLVDAFFVGKLGTSASAAIGVVLGVQSIFQAFGFMMGHGAGSQISIRLGEGDKDAADRLFSTAFFHALVISVIVGIVCLFGLEPLMRLMGSTDTILPFSKNYGFYILISGPALVGSCVLNNVMRYEGRAVLAMVGLVTGGVLNMIGDPILMFGLGLGIDGAGLSTAISQYISFGILLYMVFSKRTISRLSLRFRSNDPEVTLSIMRVGFPSLIRQMLNSISTITLNHAAMPYGDAAIAAMAIVGRIVMFIGSAMIGLGQGFQPVSAYNFGARKYARLRQAFYFTVKAGMLVLGILAIFGFLFPEPIVRVPFSCAHRAALPRRPAGRRDREQGAALSVHRCRHAALQRDFQHDVPKHRPQQRSLFHGYAPKRSLLYSDAADPAAVPGADRYRVRPDGI